MVHDVLILLRIPLPARRSVSPLPPQATFGKVAGCVLGPEGGIEVKQCAKGKALVVVEVRPQQVVIKVAAQQIGVRTCAERGEGDAVGPSGIGPFAGQQEFADAAAELGPASYNDQPGSGLTLSPPAFEKDVEFSGGDLRGSLDQLPRERYALRPSQPQQARSGGSAGTTRSPSRKWNRWTS